MVEVYMMMSLDRLDSTVGWFNCINNWVFGVSIW